jgi:hypothetical protein
MHQAGHLRSADVPFMATPGPAMAMQIPEVRKNKNLTR